MEYSQETHTIDDNPFMVEIVLELIDDTIDSVITSQLCERLNLLLSKPNVSIFSTDFYPQILQISHTLFNDQAYKSALLVLCILCKQAWFHPPKSASRSSFPSSSSSSVNSSSSHQHQHALVLQAAAAQHAHRELGSRLVSFEALIDFCSNTGTKLSHSKVMGYLVRRLIVSCILSNASESMKNHRLFSKVSKAYLFSFLIFLFFHLFVLSFFSHIHSFFF